MMAKVLRLLKSIKCVEDLFTSPLTEADRDQAIA